MLFRRARVALAHSALHLGAALHPAAWENAGLGATNTHQNAQPTRSLNHWTHRRVVGRFWRDRQGSLAAERLQSSTQSEGIMRVLSLLVLVRTAALDNTAVCRRRALLGCASGVTVLAAPRRSRAPQRANQISRHRRDLPAREQHIHTTHRSICTQARRPVRRTSSTSWCVRGGPRNGRTRNARAWTN